jgi:hypothetical protein
VSKGVDTAKATILILLIGEAAGVFAGFCPSWFTVASPFFHEQAAKDGNVKRIRAGEIAATAIVMGTGFAVATGEVGPFAIYASAAICIVFIAGYEYQIRNPSKPDDADPLGPANPMLSWGNVT